MSNSSLYPLHFPLPKGRGEVGREIGGNRIDTTKLRPRLAKLADRVWILWAANYLKGPGDKCFDTMSDWRENDWA